MWKNPPCARKTHRPTTFRPAPPRTTGHQQPPKRKLPDKTCVYLWIFAFSFGSDAGFYLQHVVYFFIRGNALLDFPSPQTVGFKVELPWAVLISSWGSWLFAMGRFVLPMGRFSIGHGAYMEVPTPPNGIVNSSGVCAGVHWTEPSVSSGQEV